MTTYKNAGVDKEEGYKTVDLIKPLVKKTYNKNVLTELGQFGALYELGKYNKILETTRTLRLLLDDAFFQCYSCCYLLLHRW